MSSTPPADVDVAAVVAAATLLGPCSPTDSQTFSHQARIRMRLARSKMNLPLTLTLLT